MQVFLLTHMVPEMAGRIITVYMGQFAEKAGRLTALGLASLLAAALLLIQTIDRAFNAIWRVREARPFVARFFVYWGILTLGPVIAGASLSATYYLIGTSLGWARTLPGLAEAVLAATPVLLTMGGLTLLYAAVPNRPVAVAHAAAGGAFAGIVFELLRRGFAWYVAGFPTYKLVYGAFAALPVFLLWIYLSWLAVLAGAVVAATLADATLAGTVRPRHAGWRFVAALDVLSALAEAQRQGQGLNLERLARHARLEAPETEALLADLVSLALVNRLQTGEWVLTRAPQDVALADLYHAFAFDQRLVARMPVLAAPVHAAASALPKTLADYQAELGTKVNTS